MSGENTQSNLQDFSSHRRNPDLSKDPALLQQSELLTTPIESVQTPAFQPSAFPNSALSWPFNTSRVPALENASLSTFSTVSPHPDSTTSLHSNSSLPNSFYDRQDLYPDHSYSEPSYSEHSYSEPSYSEYSYSERFPEQIEQTDQSSFDNANCKEQLPTDNPSGLGITPSPMSVASESYFAGPMQPNSHQQYVWGNRPYQPLQPPSGHMSQQFPPPQSYPSSGYHVGYGSHPNALPAYHHDSPAPPSYLPAVHGASRQPHSRSPSMPRSYPPHSAPGLSEHPIMSSAPPYMINQPAYYLPEAPSIPSSHPSSMSSQTSSMVAESVFSPADSGHGSDDHPVRVVTSRPRPQCWDHGCNGREFSTFSNLLRHQREKSGVVAKAECPICGAVFTRTTARNIHVAQGKCKGAGREPSQE